ncbi:MAG: CDP-diacylglycerol--serine O-phosphatidyltransferase [Candidatus Saccharicenans subterraneus]|uniref:CDP-diacylglycerol--serine O-phosphatidyltransferase n=1 Tax=Candidatus Saccharicenans subterraneus TaxID=2508984 RepID=A0A3E2BL73_9BACT|nr:MAG: CDP-diacylglycerol--serine O-phosphatidyltransferase [Candidatus Saccharicenans subterraneum]
MKVRIKQPVPRLYFLPSVFTLTNVFFGFLSLTSTFYGRYRWAALWIIIAAMLDGLDGLVARATRTSSDFGIQLDSLADAISFAAAASLLMYFWGLKVLGPAGIFFSFLFIVGGLLRLARYNVRTKSLPDRRFYQGLTVPSAAIFLASLVIFHPEPNYQDLNALYLSAVVVIISLLMISTLRYRNFVSFIINRPVDMKTGLLLAVVLTGLLFRPKYFLLLFTTLNVLYGPVDFLVLKLRRKPVTRIATEKHEPDKSPDLKE